MDTHCKGCVHHHVAGHAKDSALARTYNDWCALMGRTARKAVSYCKLKNLKKLADNLKDAPL
jgi:hypothetical protein